MRGKGTALGLIAMIAAAAPAFANDAGSIAYLALADGFWQVWRTDPDGRNAEQLTHSVGDKVRCAWFSNGKALLVSAADGRVFRLDRGTESVMPLPGPAQDAVPSPDGKTIAFSMSLAGERDNNEIFLANADGSGARRLTQLPALQHEPAWSRDGKWLYFVSGSGGQTHDIWRIRIDGGAQEQITAGALYHFEVSTGPAGELVYSGNRGGRYGLWIRREGQPSEEIASGQPFAGSPSLSPDGAEIAFEAIADGRSDIWRIPAAGGEPVRVTRSSGGARRPAWGPAR